MMKRFSWFLLLMVCLSGTLFADEGCGCCSTPFFSDIQFYADALYWRPNYSGNSYVVEGEAPGCMHFVDPEYNWGYRLGASIGVCESCFHIGASYLQFDQNNSDSLSGPTNLVAIFETTPLDLVTTMFDFAFGDVRSKYKAADIYACCQWLYCSTFESSLFVGARYFRIKEKENYRYRNNALNLDIAALQKYSLQGWGPRIGANMSIRPFSSCLLKELGVRSQIGLTVGLADQRNLMTSNDAAFILSFPVEGTLDFPKRQGIVLAPELELELFYRFCFRCLDFYVKGGYALDYYINGRLRFETTNVLGVPSLITSSIGYGGPYVGFTVIF